MLTSIFIGLSKVPGTLDCANHCTIILMCHLLRILLKIILQRIGCQLLPEIPQTPFTFMRMLGERTIHHQQNLYLVFIDYQKAFDKVRHTDLFKMLTNMRIDDKDIREVRSVYTEQLAAVCLSRGTTNWFHIKRGV